ncbi:FUSC family protein [Rhizobium sp. BK376]|uniref:FUSC family protein n=1 Tax=Rhizobium sp. BK376 TaxID=2512149 RepID=UPI0010520D23|nr:FUSC family protein [Rhizobium sp. BK376]TCR93187.1 fusaric acid resistance family protein [Rhizobium sp. BK376]
MIGELAKAIRAEAAELTLSGPRARQATNAALAVGVAILAALALRLEDPWWAGISAFVCTQASHPQSLQKGAMRIIGTAVGALAGFILTPWAAYDPLATMLLLFCAGTLAIMGALLSPHGYAWLLGGITAVMVILGALDDPDMALPIAFYRATEIVVGTVVALSMTWLLAPPEGKAPPAAPGWGSLFGPNWHVLSHATRTGTTIAFVPLIWRQLELPNLSQMAISIGAVMAVPVLTGLADADQRAINQRMLQRAAGCAIGGAIGLALQALPLMQLLLPWLMAIMAGTFVAMQVQSGRYGISGLGIQAAVALILTLVQGSGPPSSLLPAIDRLVGMFGAIALLVLVNLLMGPPVTAGSDLEAGRD